MSERLHKTVMITNSYTGEVEAVEALIIKQTAQNRGLYREIEREPVQYMARQVFHPSAPSSTEPVPSEMPATWEIIRFDPPRGGVVLLSVPNVEVAKGILDYFVLGDDAIEMAVNQALAGNKQPMMEVIGMALKFTIAKLEREQAT